MDIQNRPIGSTHSPNSNFNRSSTALFTNCHSPNSNFNRSSIALFTNCRLRSRAINGCPWCLSALVATSSASRYNANSFALAPQYATNPPPFVLVATRTHFLILFGFSCCSPRTPPKSARRRLQASKGVSAEGAITVVARELFLVSLQNFII